MSYVYEDFREWLSTTEGAKATGEVLRNIETKLDPAGCAMMAALLPHSTGDSWRMLAAVDRCVEMGVLREVQQAREPAGQYRIFIRGHRP